MAGRKEYELLFKLQAALGGNFNTVFQSALNTTKQMLRRHDEELLDEIDERERQRQDDERRRNYD